MTDKIATKEKPITITIQPGEPEICHVEGGEEKGKGGEVKGKGGEVKGNG